MNQIGDKPEEVRKHHEEERRQARKDRREPGERAAEAPEPDRVKGAAPDDEAYSTFDAYEEPEDRP
ncbi:hypothetical protein [Streptomyces sp. TRM49041]|uniref:hypothetical protein n=1 Tax=Streptomyces sp. TRM49041 TaxID=2603216 RepID=UPI0011EE9B36|nr:hypothetical protein [Streptomyces sp. TRM49041]